MIEIRVSVKTPWPMTEAAGRFRLAIRIVRLGTPRATGEGLRVGTVRRPPRGVSKNEYASQNWYDTWLPNLAPTPELIKLGKTTATDREWTAFVKKYRTEKADPKKSRVIDLLGALSHHADFSIGCHCADESRCHRSVLRALLVERGAQLE